MTFITFTASDGNTLKVNNPSVFQNVALTTNDSKDHRASYENLNNTHKVT